MNFTVKTIRQLRRQFNLGDNSPIVIDGYKVTSVQCHNGKIIVTTIDDDDSSTNDHKSVKEYYDNCNGYV